jgi:hypothetical protein
LHWGFALPSSFPAFRSPVAGDECIQGENK